MNLLKSLRGALAGAAAFGSHLVAMGKERGEAAPLRPVTLHDRYRGPGLWNCDLHSEVELAFARAMAPRPKPAHKRKRESTSRGRSSYVHHVYSLSPDEYLIGGNGTVRRLEPKNEYKARKRAEWKAVLDGRRLALAAA